MPIVADAEAGFGGPLNAFELMKSMIAAGAAGVHWEDQLASEKKCGHMGGKVLVPTAQHVRTLNAARLAADISGVPTLVIARTDALAADLLTSDVDEHRPAVPAPASAPPRASTGCAAGIEPVLRAGKAYAPYCRPDLGGDRHARTSAWPASSPTELHKEFPGKMLAYNCSPSFNWKAALDDAQIATLPGRARRPRLQVPVHHPGRLPRAQPLDVPPGAGLRHARA